jgi:hypothetical protein
MSAKLLIRSSWGDYTVKTVAVLITVEGADAPVLRQVPPDHTIEALAEEVAPGSVAFLPEGDGPLSDELTLLEAGLGAGGEITLAKSKKITVPVFYGGIERSKEWAPSQRLRRIFKWSLGKQGFDIPHDEEPQFELALDATDETVDLDATVASLVGTTGEIAGLDLRRISAPQGAL